MKSKSIDYREPQFNINKSFQIKFGSKLKHLRAASKAESNGSTTINREFSEEARIVQETQVPEKRKISVGPPRLPLHK